jgi:hypothetical protein
MKAHRRTVGEPADVEGNEPCLAGRAFLPRCDVPESADRQGERTGRHRIVRIKGEISPGEPVGRFAILAIEEERIPYYSESA